MLMLTIIMSIHAFFGEGARAAVVVAAKHVAKDLGNGYIPVSQMDLLCGQVFIHSGFLCDVTWESGAIGDFVDVRNVTQQIEALPSAFANYSRRVNSTVSDFVWFSGIDTPLSPELAKDRRYTWLPAPCAVGVYSSRQQKQAKRPKNSISDEMVTARLKPLSMNIPPPS
jgi:hypothetical protein